MTVKEVIQQGKNNALTNKQIMALTGISHERAVRGEVEKLRANGDVIINLQDGRGYFRPEAPEDFIAQYKLNASRAGAILSQQKHIKQAMREYGISIKEEQVDGQMKLDIAPDGISKETQELLNNKESEGVKKMSKNTTATSTMAARVFLKSQEDLDKQRANISNPEHNQKYLTLATATLNINNDFLVKGIKLQTMEEAGTLFITLPQFEAKVINDTAKVAITSLIVDEYGKELKEPESTHKNTVAEPAADLSVSAVVTPCGANKRVADVELTIGDAVAVNTNIVSGKKGDFHAMKSYKGADGEYRDKHHAISKEFRNKMDEVVLAEWEKVKAEAEKEMPEQDCSER